MPLWVVGLTAVDRCGCWEVLSGVTAAQGTGSGSYWSLIACLLPLLAQCDPPLEVKDLFLDIQDGRILMALLEVLSGRNLVRTALEGEGES